MALDGFIQVMGNFVYSDYSIIYQPKDDDKTINIKCIDSMAENSTPKDLADFVFNKLANVKAAYQKPSNNILQDLFENLFYVSLKTEEAQFIRVTITLIDPEHPDPSPPKSIRADRWQYFHFENRIPFNVKNLTKLSKAADVWSSSLAVFYDANSELFIWGMIDQAVHYQTYLNHEADVGPEQPGLFQATIGGVGNINVIMDYEMIASLKQNVLIGNFIDVFKRGNIYAKIKSIAAPFKEKIAILFKDAIPPEEISIWDAYIENVTRNCIIRILLRIQNYQHGGALLITANVSADIDVKYKIDYKRLNLAISNLVKLNILSSNYSESIFADFIEKGEDEMPVELYLDEVVSKGNQDDTKDEVKGAFAL